MFLRADIAKIAEHHQNIITAQPTEEKWALFELEIVTGYVLALFSILGVLQYLPDCFEP